MTFDPISMARPWLLDFVPYASERDSAGQEGLVLLDMNENPFGGLGVNRYPGPEVAQLYRRLADFYAVPQDQLLVVPGSDEVIGMVIRAFCAPGQHKVLVCPPTFGMYALSAKINGVACRSVPLKDLQHVDWTQIEAVCQADADTRVIFLCTPQNPSGAEIPRAEILAFAHAFPDRLIVVDEAYQEFADGPSLIADLAEHPNLIIMRTLSKAFGLAGARIGSMIADPRVVAIVRALQTPYPLPTPSVAAALSALAPAGMAKSKRQIASLRQERERMATALAAHPRIQRVLPSAANFLFVLADDAPALQAQLLQDNRILVRNQNAAVTGGLRIGIGTPTENDLLLEALGLAPSRAPQRQAEAERNTKETSIYIAVNLDQASADTSKDISTGVGFFDHMLEQLAKHSGISMIIQTQGDTHIDTHHTVEDTMILLGKVLDQALGDKRGIVRYGHSILPMDETRAEVAIDLSGRAAAVFEGSFSGAMLGGLQTEMVEHCVISLAESLRAAIHVRVEGRNDHHKCEAVFKGLAKALKMAVARDGDALPSTKGLL